MGSFTSKSIEPKYYADFEASLPTLEGKTVAFSGCTSGTGLVAAQCAARKGADHVIMLNRPSERATAAQETVQAQVPSGAKTVVETIACDLQDFASVKQAAATIKKKYKKLDVLCNNAGVMALDDYATKDGYDVQMQTNHLSHFLLTKELFPLLKAASGTARIVHHSSMARKGGPLQPEYFGKNGGNLGGNSNGWMFSGPKWERYHQSKLANAVMTLALADRLEQAGFSNSVIAACAAPGYAATNLQTTTQEQGGGMSGAMWTRRFAQSAEDGTMPLLAACFHPDTANGDFWEPVSGGGMWGQAGKKELEPVCQEKEQQTLLWKASEEACGTFEF